MKPLNFFIECDPVVFDCWIVDKKTNKKLREATSEEAELWEHLIFVENQLNEFERGNKTEGAVKDA